MQLGRKYQNITSSLGVKNQKVSLGVGVKQNHNLHMDSDNSIKDNSANGIINHSNSNVNSYQPIKGISLPSHKVETTNRNYLEKAHKIKRSSDRNNFI